MKLCFARVTTKHFGKDSFKAFMDMGQYAALAVWDT